MQILDSEILKQKIDEIVEYDLVNNNVFGSSYFVYQNGNVIYKSHYGVTGNGDAVSDNSLFRLASMTKPITAVAMLILEEKGLICLSDPISKYIPGFKHIHIKADDGKDLGEVKNEPTILSMLCHASGFGVRVITKDSYEVLPVGTFGWSGAHGSHFWVDPENNIVAVFMKNSRFDGGSDNESARRFEKAVHDSLK